MSLLDEKVTKEGVRRKRVFQILLFLPYFAGLSWTCLHPIVSVLTGEFKCRGWFLDENAIETRFQTRQARAQISLPDGFSTLCDVLQQTNRTNVWCSSNHADSFHVAVLVPLSNAIDPTDEAIVLVVPSPEKENWYSNSFHYALAEAMNRLVDPIATPWLAKTVIVVSPSKPPMGSGDDSASLEAAVSSFLDAYLGSKSTTSAIAPLPPRYCRAILRNMIVVNLRGDSGTWAAAPKGAKKAPAQTDLSILSQGRRGALPNLDLVTLVGKLYQRASFLDTRLYPSSTFLAHGYTQRSKDAKQVIDKRLVSEEPTRFRKKAQAWANEMVDLGLFAYTMATGPYPPHWPALDRGIDSLTLKVSFQGLYRNDPNLEAVRILENVLRALSNLHERLHHSFVLYWLPSPDKFVSHMEYFLPTIFILLPLATRAFGMILTGDLPKMNLCTVGSSFCVSLLTMVAMSAISLFGPSGTSDGIAWTNACLLVFYGVVAALWRRTHRNPKVTAEETKRRTQSLQFAACATAAYLLVPIAFCHSALVYIPGMLLVPLLTFPAYGQTKNGAGKRLQKWSLIGLWVLTAPPFWIVPQFFASYTIFVNCAYIPMHVQLLLLVSLS